MHHNTNILATVICDRYQLIDLLGKGSFGITYSAIDLQTQEQVAIKEVSLKQIDNWKQIELIEREVKVLAQLNHPAIPKYLDYFQIDNEQDKLFYIVQQLAPGKSLFQLVESGWRTTEEEVKEIAQQILDIFIYLHLSFEPHVIHRDIKPDNLIRSKEGKIYLVDFGAVQNTYYNTLVRGSTVVGTFGYMAPEQFQGKATPATDLYGLGATILYLLTHRSPAELPHDTLKINFRDSVNISEGFANWLERMLQPDLEDRFVSATEALDSLRDRVAWASPNRNLLTNTIKNKWKLVLNLCLFSAISIGGIVAFNSYKWGILSRLGYSPVNFFSSPEVIKDYLKRGGDLNIKLDGNSPYIPQGTNSFPLGDNIIEAIRTAIAHDDWEIIQLLVARGVDFNIKDANGRTPLFETAKSDSSDSDSSEVAKDLIKYLIVNGADVNAKDNQGQTPLFEAAWSGNLEAAKLLIINGADIDVKNNQGETLLFDAARSGNLELAKYLIINGADIDVKNKNGRTPLLEALGLNNQEIVELLMAKDAK